MLKVHGVSLSPFVRKVHWGLIHKDVAFEAIPTMPGDASPEFHAMSPLGKIPVLQDGDFTIPDSSIILRYLDARYPDNALYPEDPQACAFVSWLEEFADTKLVEACAVFFRERFLNPNMFKKSTDQDAVDNALTEQMPPLLRYLESVVNDEGYFVGATLSVADLAITSAFVNAQYGDYSVDSAAYPKLSAYLLRAMDSGLVKDQIAKEQVILKSLG